MEDEITKRIDEHERRISVLESKFDKGEKPVVGKRISSKEFLLESGAKDGPQKTVALGFYLENERKYECFNVNDIVTIFREAKESPPGNPNDIINKCIGKDWIMPHSSKKDEKSAYVLTNTGETIVKNKFKK